MPPDRGDQGVGGGPVDDRVRAEHAAGLRGPGDPEVVGGGQHGDVVPVGAEVGVAQLQQGGPAREVLLRDAEALADDVAQIVGDHVVLRRHELREAAAGQGLGGRRLDQQDAGSRGDGVGGLHVGGRLTGRIHHVRVLRVVARHAAHGLQHPERRRPGQAERGVEDPQVMTDRGGAERVHDDDRAAPAVQAPGVQRREVVGPLDLARRVAGQAVAVLARGGRGRRGGGRPGGGGRGRPVAVWLVWLLRCLVARPADGPGTPAWLGLAVPADGDHAEEGTGCRAGRVSILPRPGSSAGPPGGSARAGGGGARAVAPGKRRAPRRGLALCAVLTAGGGTRPNSARPRRPAYPFPPGSAQAFGVGSSVRCAASASPSNPTVTAGRYGSVVA